MDILLTPELEEFVTRKVQSGLYRTASEVVREGLQLLREQESLHQENLEELRREIALGIAEADAGKLAPFNAQETLARIRQKRQGNAPKT